MEIIEQIKEICFETNNDWFLSHSFPRVALFDLQLEEKLKKERNINMFDYECICSKTDSTQECISCEIENVEDIWKKCGFQYHDKINNNYIIYKKISDF